MIDYLDMLSATKLLIPNQESIDHSERFVRDSYKYNIMIQIELSAINGISGILRSDQSKSDEGAVLDQNKGILKRSNISVASVFL